MKTKIEEGDFIRCIYEDESELYGTVLWVNPNQTIISVDSNGVITFINANASSLELIEIMESES